MCVCVFFIINKIKTNKVKKDCYLTRQYNIQILNKIFFKYSTRKINEVKKECYLIIMIMMIVIIIIINIIII